MSLSLFRSLFASLLEVDSEQQSQEHHQDAEEGLPGEDVVVENAGQEDAHCLTGHHDESEHNRTEYSDGVEDEELTDC